MPAVNAHGVDKMIFTLGSEGVGPRESAQAPGRAREDVGSYIEMVETG